MTIKRQSQTKNSIQPNRIHPADIERLITVAGRLFAAHGFDGVGMRRIAIESGLHLSSIQYHFESKQALFEEVLENKYDSFYGHISQKVSCASGPKERLQCAISTLFDSLIQDDVFLMLLHRDIVDMIADRHRTAFFQGYSRYYALAKELLEGTLKRTIDDTIMFALISVILGYTELAMALRKATTSDSDDAWLAQQRGRMVEIVDRICMM